MVRVLTRNRGDARDLKMEFFMLSTTVGLNSVIGKKVIVRTDSDGVWFGEIVEKSGMEVCIKNARRMYYWKAKEGITISAMALYGIDTEKSKIIEAVPLHWTLSIGLTLCNDEAIASIESAENVKAM